MNKDVIECERKWIMAGYPHPASSLKPTEIMTLEYIFSPEGVRFQKEWVRDRSNPPLWLKVDKTPKRGEDGKISPSSRKEVITEISKTEFDNVMTNMDHVYLSKTRYVYETGGLKAEVDVYNEHMLVTLEVEKTFSKEDPNWHEKAKKFEKQSLYFPPQIGSLIIAEVTGMKEFSNFFLAQITYKSTQAI